MCIISAYTNAGNGLRELREEPQKARISPLAEWCNYTDREKSACPSLISGCDIRVGD
jgi:hypothetical protein